MLDSDTSFSYVRSSRSPGPYSLGALRIFDQDNAALPLTDVDTIPSTGGVAGPIAFAAIAALLVDGALVSLSRRSPAKKEDPPGGQTQ